MTDMQKITPNLWFNRNAQEAADYYVSVFPDSKIVATSYYPSSAEEGLADFQRELAGRVLTVDFELAGQHFTAINAGPEFTFSEAVSFSVICKDQAEIDYYWDKLSAVPGAEQCGWCKDRYGLSWQVVPQNMNEIMNRSGAFAKLMQMKKSLLRILTKRSYCDDVLTVCRTPEPELRKDYATVQSIEATIAFGSR